MLTRETYRNARECKVDRNREKDDRNGSCVAAEASRVLQTIKTRADRYLRELTQESLNEWKEAESRAWGQVKEAIAQNAQVEAVS